MKTDAHRRSDEILADDRFDDESSDPTRVEAISYLSDYKPLRDPGVVRWLKVIRGEA